MFHKQNEINTRQSEKLQQDLTSEPINSLDVQNFDNYFLIEVIPNSPIGRIVSKEDALNESGDMREEYRQNGRQLNPNYRWLHKKTKIDPWTGGNITFVTVSTLTHLAIWIPQLINNISNVTSNLPAWVCLLSGVAIASNSEGILSTGIEVYHRVNDRSLTYPDFPGGSEVPLDELNAFDAIQKILATIDDKEKLLAKHNIKEPVTIQPQRSNVDLPNTRKFLPFCESPPDINSCFNGFEWTGIPGFLSGRILTNLASGLIPALATIPYLPYIVGGVCCIGTHVLAKERSNQLRKTRLREEASGIIRQRKSCCLPVCLFNYPSETHVNLNNETRKNLLDIYKNLYLRSEELSRILHENGVQESNSDDRPRSMKMIK